CAGLVHVIDMATWEPNRDPVTDLTIIETELADYAVDLDDDSGLLPPSERPKLVALNKVDIPDGRDLADIVRPDLEAAGYRVFEISAVSHAGLRELSFAMAELVLAERERREQIVATPQRVVIRPKAVDDRGFESRAAHDSDGPLFRVLGDELRPWGAPTPAWERKPARPAGSARPPTTNGWTRRPRCEPSSSRSGWPSGHAARAHRSASRRPIRPRGPRRSERRS